MNDGGPAFPHTEENCGITVLKCTGMTLLDWFAGQALAGLLASECVEGDPKLSYRESATEAYKQAAAMIDERNRITAQASPARHPSLPER